MVPSYQSTELRRTEYGIALLTEYNPFMFVKYLKVFPVLMGDVKLEGMQHVFNNVVYHAEKFISGEKSAGGIT